MTLDGHLAGAAARAFKALSRKAPGLECELYCAGEWASHPDQLDRCIEAIGEANIIIVSMLFMEDQFLPVLPALKARRDGCD
ncbi:MAG: DUF3479 domain-containing protein, partial [Pseudomonadota bacterium]